MVSTQVNLRGSNVRDILGKYFEENPIPESNSEQFGSNFLLEGVIKFTNCYS